MPASLPRWSGSIRTLSPRPFVLFIVALSLALSPACSGRTGRASAAGPLLTARLERTFEDRAGQPRELAFSPDGLLLAKSSTAGGIEFVRAADGTVSRTLTAPGGVASVAFSPDGLEFATGGYDGAVRIWNLASGTSRALAAHRGTVWSVAFSPDGRRLASSGEDATVRIWLTADGALLHTLTGHTLNVWCVRFSPDGQRLASASFDHSIRIWSADEATAPQVLRGHTQAVVHISFSPDGALLASGGDDSTVRLWRVGDGALLATANAFNHVYTVAFSPDGVWLASGGREKGSVLTLWKQLAGHRLMQRSPTVGLWRVRDGALVASIAEHWDDVVSVAFSPDGRWLATASEDKTVKLWSLARTVTSALGR